MEARDKNFYQRKVLEMKSPIMNYQLIEENFLHTGYIIPFDCSSSGNFLEEFRDAVRAPEWMFELRAIRKERVYA